MNAAISLDDFDERNRTTILVNGQIAFHQREDEIGIFSHVPVGDRGQKTKPGVDPCIRAHDTKRVSERARMSQILQQGRGYLLT
ncbi:MAG: hypothetical protein RJB62_1276 [Pseudomonadota bacterium]